jgi:ketosteroid isomerase-like protein
MFASAVAAEAAFYEAFSTADLAAMMAVWAVAVDIVCIHPSGPRLEGIDEIQRSWSSILADGMPRSFALRGRLVMGTADLRIHTLEENITVPGTAFVAPPVLATNVYQRLHDGWYMILHHASVAPNAIGSGPGPASTSGSNKVH